MIAWLRKAWAGMIAWLRKVAREAWASYSWRRVLSATLVALGVSWTLPPHVAVLQWLGVVLAVYFGIVLLP